MLAQVNSSAILGIDAYVVRVEVDISSAVPMFTIVGLPDAAVQESRERVRSASPIIRCGYQRHGDPRRPHLPHPAVDAAAVGLNHSVVRGWRG